ncbi:hypothetical protein Ngar_c20790 [Candidatus Nitrososphaera gargensis Ga9.2]|uniref:Uncharacterized protein n=1 Tax=Nitrososphaera gargensis (strain Ga9.2) TaxID=1237085 RepID=K0IGQ3_NITGG|nr:hypothetical protein [Candidatus Nitrososphaera gargensis]AFU59010.1 hypothetical protein Ngar_c20790 [Candidatus Nitrososphaera gargensis Ga9.2]
MPNQGLGREMGKEEEEGSADDVNVQEIASDPHTGNTGIETSFSHVRKTKQE